MSEQPAPGDVLLRLQGVSASVGGRRVLDRVSFELRAGQLTGLIGSNGAGKTTVFRVILGLQPAAGRIELSGRAGRHRQAIAYVPQSVPLDPDIPLRARDLVGLGLDGHRPGLPLPSRRRRQLVDDMLAAVDGTRFADSRVGRLSGGEQRRVLIAQALIGQPRVLLLDEPLINLDISSEQEVVELLARLTRERRLAVLISAHDMNPLLRVMDRIVYLAGGRAASGTTAEVVRSDVLSRLYGHPVEVLRVGRRVLVLAGGGESAASDEEHAHAVADQGLG